MVSPRSDGRGLAGLLWACAAVVVLVLSTRWVSARASRTDALAARAGVAVREALAPEPTLPDAPARAREELAPAPDGAAEPAAAPAPATLTGRLQINGTAARRGRVWLRTRDGSFEQRLVIDPYGRFFATDVPADELLLGFEAEGLFERQLLLPDRLTRTFRPGELEVLDLDWWTRQVNVFVRAEDDVLGPARVTLLGPGQELELEVDASGIARLDLVGEGIFTFRARTPDGREGSAELELEPGDELDTVVLVPRVKKS